MRFSEGVEIWLGGSAVPPFFERGSVGLENELHILPKEISRRGVLPRFEPRELCLDVLQAVWHHQAHQGISETALFGTKEVARLRESPFSI
jgi:hypothetical protein